MVGGDGKKLTGDKWTFSKGFKYKSEDNIKIIILCNIKMNFKEIEYEGVDWFPQIQHWHAVLYLSVS
jgi:hypothetical protein